MVHCLIFCRIGVWSQISVPWWHGSYIVWLPSWQGFDQFWRMAVACEYLLELVHEIGVDDACCYACFLGWLDSEVEVLWVLAGVEALSYCIPDMRFACGQYIFNPELISLAFLCFPVCWIANRTMWRTTVYVLQDASLLGGRWGDMRKIG